MIFDKLIQPEKAAVLIICNFSPALSNLENRIDELDDTEETGDHKYRYERIEDLIHNKDVARVIKLSLNGREDFFLRNYSIYYDSRFTDKLFGISWCNREKINYDVCRPLPFAGWSVCTDNG